MVLYLKNIQQLILIFNNDLKQLKQLTNKLPKIDINKNKNKFQVKFKSDKNKSENEKFSQKIIEKYRERCISSEKKFCKKRLSRGVFQV